uniref:CSD domain-containing protein n=1 Tax=Tetradesmus obliquus TaxID=3088 RepID=A0A383VYA4_TETOB|eukprot:jgi/Sobl393_1/2229/SZX70458.1
MADQAVATRYLGTVSAKRKAFGFIRAAELPLDVFFHSASCSDFDDLAVGDAVEFAVEQQPGGKKAAVGVCKASKAAPDLQSVQDASHIGLVATDTAVARLSSGYLRYMDQQGAVQHLTFSVQDFAAEVNSIARGQPVKFQVLIDRRQQLLQAKQAESGGAAGTSSKHAFMRATQLRPLSTEEQALLTPLQQKQLLVLEALADTFDSAGGQAGT